jgi:hypothetical protein
LLASQWFTAVVSCQDNRAGCLLAPIHCSVTIMPILLCRDLTAGAAK